MLRHCHVLLCGVAYRLYGYKALEKVMGRVQRQSEFKPFWRYKSPSECTLAALPNHQQRQCRKENGWIYGPGLSKGNRHGLNVGEVGRVSPTCSMKGHDTEFASIVRNDPLSDCISESASTPLTFSRENQDRRGEYILGQEL